MLIKKKIIVKKNFKSNYWRKRNYTDGKIDWRMSAVSIHNLVRALDKPYMHPHFYLKNKEIKVVKSRVLSFKNNSKNENFEPGKILFKKDTFFDVKCGSGVLRVLKINHTLNLTKTNYL